MGLFLRVSFFSFKLMYSSVQKDIESALNLYLSGYLLDYA